jgi:hypothetical protein
MQYWLCFNGTQNFEPPVFEALGRVAKPCTSYYPMHVEWPVGIGVSPHRSTPSF